MAGKWTARVKNLFKQQAPVVEKKTMDDDYSANQEGWHYSNRVRNKLTTLVEDFAQGRVNRAQFEVLYAHYQKERDAVEKLIATQPSSDAWRMAMTEGQSVVIRRRLAARVLGYAVYADQDPTPLRTYGELASLNEEQLASLLNYVDPKDKEQPFIIVNDFDMGSEEATCLCVVPGELAVLFVSFTTEPARVQIQLLKDLHQHFERANYRVLARSFYKPSDLVFPYAAAFE
jgi:hypothetical protein